MMIGEKEEKDQSSRYFGYSYSRYGNTEEKKDDDEFRVDADVENNMLLLWANEIEIESVRQLLVKLGEIPPEGGRTSKMRVMNAIAPEDAAKFLERLRQAWPSLAPNELNLPTLPKPEKDAAPEPAPKPQEAETKEVRRAASTLQLAVFDAGEQDEQSEPYTLR